MKTSFESVALETIKGEDKGQNAMSRLLIVAR